MEGRPGGKGEGTERWASPRQLDEKQRRKARRLFASLSRADRRLGKSLLAGWGRNL